MFHVDLDGTNPQMIAKEGLRIKTGVEPEFFILNAEGTGISDAYDTAEKPCYDQQAVMRRYDVISEICDYMLELGWEAYQNDHEDAIGQFEMNWKYDDALQTADKHSFFKFMVKSVSEKHGFRATFMPKPFKGLTGSGCHAHISVWSLDGKKNAFSDPSKELSLSDQGRNFLGGIMKHASALAAITNPTVNSYMDLLNANDFDNLIQLFLPDGALQPPFQKPIVGTEAILRFFREDCQNLRLLPERGYAEPTEGDFTQIKVTGKVQTPWFGAGIGMNVAWRFLLNPEGKIYFVAIDLLASPAELLKFAR